MKKIIAPVIAFFLVAACNTNKDIPEVSKIKVNIVLERFDNDFFKLDSNSLPGALRQLQARYPGFYTDYMQGILGVSGAETDPSTQKMVRMMLANYASLYAVVAPKLSNASGLEKELKKSFQFVKYYFPEYKVPGFICFIGTLDAPGMVITEKYLAIGLHQYAGKDFKGYQSEQVRQLYPAYISRRFETEFIPANCMKAVVSDLFPDKSNTKPLIEQMIEKGKQWWLVDQFLPETADSIKTGYTKQQLDWCQENEGLIWSYIIKNENLYAVDPVTIQNYIGEGPFTQGFSQEYSPGNIGPWIGRQIVKKYAAAHSGMKPEQVMLASPKQILEQAKYKPK
jgi:hypothetical protein